MLTELKKIMYQDNFGTALEAAADSVVDDDEVRNDMLDDLDVTVVGAENDPEIKELVDNIPVDDDDPDTMTEEDVKDLVESLIDDDVAGYTLIESTDDADLDPDLVAEEDLDGIEEPIVEDDEDLDADIDDEPMDPVIDADLMDIDHEPFVDPISEDDLMDVDNELMDPVSEDDLTDIELNGDLADPTVEPDAGIEDIDLECDLI